MIWIRLFPERWFYLAVTPDNNRPFPRVLWTGTESCLVNIEQLCRSSHLCEGIIQFPKIREDISLCDFIPRVFKTIRSDRLQFWMPRFETVPQGSPTRPSTVDPPFPKGFCKFSSFRGCWELFRTESSKFMAKCNPLFLLSGSCLDH
jgi:hypothetical protein